MTLAVMASNLQEHLIARDQLHFLEIGDSAYLAVVDAELRGVLFCERDLEDECQTGEPEDTFRWLWVPVDTPQVHTGLSGAAVAESHDGRGEASERKCRKGCGLLVSVGKALGYGTRAGRVSSQRRNQRAVLPATLGNACRGWAERARRAAGPGGRGPKTKRVYQ
jgi:hypothetical protein